MIAKSIAVTSTATPTLDYLHHDKGGALTAERVAWAENVNCIQASAEETERMWAQLVDDAPEIKRQAGGSTRGRRLENPYAHYVLSWAPDENPSREEMMTATGDAMDRLGYKGCQRRVVAHSDTDHKHAHVIVCRVHPETGRAMGRKNDGDRLREWSLEYEKAQGQIRVPGRLDDLTNRARYMRQKREQPDKKPPRATDAEKKRRRERRHRRARTRDAIGRPTNPTDSERQEWAALFQSQPTRSEKAALKKAQTERRIKAERSERAVAATPPLMELRPAPMKPPELARVRLDDSPAPPTMELRPAPTLHRELARVRLDDSPAPPTMEIPTRPSPEDPLVAWSRRQPRQRQLTRREIEAEVDQRFEAEQRAFGQVPRPPAERPATARVPTPAEERPAVAQVPRPDQDLAATPGREGAARKRKRRPPSPPSAASPAPQTRAAPQPAAIRDQAAAPPPPRRQPAPVEMAPRPDEAAQREAARRHEEEIQAARVHAYAMDGGTEREGADLAKRHPALGGALGAAVWTQLEDQYAATPVQKMRQDIALEILAVAKHASRASSGRHAPPPRPEAVAKDVQDSANRLIHHAVGKLDLDISLAPDRTQAEPAPAAAPADEQPARPPASEAPQHDQPAAAGRYRSPIAPVQGSEAGPGGDDSTVHQKDRKKRGR